LLTLLTTNLTERSLPGKEGPARHGGIGNVAPCALVIARATAVSSNLRGLAEKKSQRYRALLLVDFLQLLCARLRLVCTRLRAGNGSNGRHALSQQVRIQAMAFS
jgi:hypothetical protein